MSTTDPPQRIVLLIDLTPIILHNHQNPKPYLTTILSLSKTLLSLPSLFSYKLFFSSLSPILSSSHLPSSSISLSFNDSLSTLQSLSTSLAKARVDPNLSSTPRASNIAASMRQLVHEYGWDLIDSTNSGEFSENLVVLLSPIRRDLKWLSDFMDVGIDDSCLSDVDVFTRKFSGVFESVNDAFVKRGIHFSWVDVNCALFVDDGDNNNNNNNNNKNNKNNKNKNKNKNKNGRSGLELRLFESGIKGLGWGYSSSDSILLGSALVPFGLIYPRIGVLSKCFDVDQSVKRVSVPLSLEILDVNGKPLECKVCDLQLVEANMLSPRQCNNDVLITPGFVNPDLKGREQKRLFWDRFGSGISKFHVNAVWKCEELDKLKGQLSHPILVCESLDAPNKDKKESFGEFYADKVLDILAKDFGQLDKRKPVPTWPIFLSYLYRKDCSALITLSNVGGDSCKGILQPFTISSALFSDIEDNFCSQFDLLNICYRSAPSSSCKGKKKSFHLFKDLTWSAFCKAALENSEIPLEEIYYISGHNKAKKLKFLKCWIKQIEKSGCGNLTLPEKSTHVQNITKEVNPTSSEHPRESESKEVDDRVSESEHPIPSSASVAEDCQSGASRIQDTAAVCFRSETLEIFFDDLPAKIQQGLQSEGVDLKALAERLVNSSLYWLYQKHGTEKNNSQNQTPVSSSKDACDRGHRAIADELIRILLSDPKHLVAMHKKSDPSSKASDPAPQHSASKDIVEEYELQILFRMEILQSEAGAGIDDALKQKLVKQICFLLEAIQCHLEVGFFGDWSLKSYVEKIIKCRYCHTLGDVIDKIYTKMDLLLFSDGEDDPPSHLLNSEESNQSWKEEENRHEKHGISKTNKLNTVKKETIQRKETTGESPHGNKTKESAQKLIKAQEKRERARRFSSFTRLPDLHKVWAAKQPKLIKPMLSFFQKPSKRIRASCDRVCETPMTGNKRSCSRSSDGEEHNNYASPSGGSVTKALFQDDV